MMSIDPFVTCPDPEQTIRRDFCELFAPAIRRLSDRGVSKLSRGAILDELSSFELAEAWLWMRCYRRSLNKRSAWWPIAGRDALAGEARHWCNARETALRSEVDRRIRASTSDIAGRWISFAEALKWAKAIEQDSAQTVAGVRS